MRGLRRPQLTRRLNRSASADPGHRPVEHDGPEHGRRAQAIGSERVENTLENLGRKAGHFLAVAFARAREEAEDLWAEAQSVRKGERD